MTLSAGTASGEPGGGIRVPMNLLFIFPVYEPAWAFGGVVRAMSSLCRGLAALGHRVTVYTTNASGAGPPLMVPCAQPVDQGGVAVYYYPSFGPGSGWDSLGLRRQLRQTLADFQLVYASAIWQWLGVKTAALCAQQGVPLVVGPHGSFDKVLRRRRGWRKMLYWSWFLKRSLRRAAALHFTTNYERQESADLLSGFESFVVANSLDCNYFQPRPDDRADFRRQYGLSPDGPVVIAVGRPDRKKRVDLLIRSLARLSEINLLVVGSEQGEVAADWKALAANQMVADRVTFTGHLEGEALVKAYAAADLLAMLSDDENFGNVVVEAMACQLPVLVSPRVGCWDDLQSSQVGMTVSLEATAVEAALGHFLRERTCWADWGRNGRHVAQERFSVPQVAALMARAFEDLLSGARSEACRWATAGR
jgi:glycosyltransferase involved in cell wall biosynthesis